MENRPEWMSDPSLSNIEENKLLFLSELVTGCQGKNQKELMAFMMAKMKQAKAEAISFSSAEVGTVINAIKKYSTPEELQQIDNLMKKAPVH
ncbi:MAG: hypothetical protein J1E83_03480 [Lachnospiraceae bacterium]|nr:hypothetical protein [Lachnospiraceae bacterium]